MEPKTATPPSRLRAAYDYLKSEDVTVPENYDEFEAGVQEPERLQKLYDYFKANDVTVPDKYDDFAAGMLEGVSKKKTWAHPRPLGPHLLALCRLVCRRCRGWHRYWLALLRLTRSSLNNQKSCNLASPAR